MENSVEIREMRPQDVKRAAEIAAQATEAYTEKQLAECIADGINLPLTAFCGEKLCGVAVFQTAADEAELHGITVDKAQRGKHIGIALLRYGLCVLKQNGIKSVFLEVRKSNAAARGMYEKCGFYNCGERRAFYKNPPDDAVLMRKDI